MRKWLHFVCPSLAKGAALVLFAQLLTSLPAAAATQLYVTSQFTRSIVRYDGTDGSYIDSFGGSEINDPLDLIHGIDGHLLLSNGNNDNILSYDAEDVLQETFLLAYRGLERYREQDRFRAWLFRILVNQCRSQGRRRARQARRFLFDQQAQAAAVVEGSSAGEGLDDHLQAALDTLDPLLREALVLKYGEDLAYEDMARMTGASISALKMRVKRARDSVRARLEELAHE